MEKRLSMTVRGFDGLYVLNAHIHVSDVRQPAALVGLLNRKFGRRSKLLYSLNVKHYRDFVERITLSDRWRCHG